MSDRHTEAPGTAGWFFREHWERVTRGVGSAGPASQWRSTSPGLILNLLQNSRMTVSLKVLCSLSLARFKNCLIITRSSILPFTTKAPMPLEEREGAEKLLFVLSSLPINLQQESFGSLVVFWPLAPPWAMQVKWLWEKKGGVFCA